MHSLKELEDKEKEILKNFQNEVFPLNLRDDGSQEATLSTKDSEAKEEPKTVSEKERSDFSLLIHTTSSSAEPIETHNAESLLTQQKTLTTSEEKEKIPDQKALLKIIKDTHNQISGINEKFTGYLFNKVLEIQFNQEAKERSKVIKVTEIRIKDLEILQQYFGNNWKDKFNIYQAFMAKCGFELFELYKEIDILKICTDIFKLLNSAQGQKLIERLIEGTKLNTILFQFFGQKLLYMPQIKDKTGAKQAQINEKIPGNITDADETIQVSKNLLKENKALANDKKILGNVTLKGVEYRIILNPNLISIKVNKERDSNKILLSYAPRLTSLAHELIHVAHTQAGTHYADVPTDKLKLIRFCYSNFEELYTIALDEDFSESSLNEELGYNSRIGHIGYAATESSYSEENASKISTKLQVALIKGSIMAGILKLDTPDISKFYEHYIPVPLGAETEHMPSPGPAYKLYRHAFGLENSMSLVEKGEANQYNVSTPLRNNIIDATKTATHEVSVVQNL